MNIHREIHYLKNQHNKQMKTYYYLLFRIYMFYKDTMKENNNLLLLLSTSIIPSIIFSINLLSIYYMFVYWGLFAKITAYFIVFLGIMFALLNFIFFVNKKVFLKQNFKKDTKGGFAVIGLIILTTLLFITVANFNRAKIFNKKSALENTNK